MFELWFLWSWNTCSVMINFDTFTGIVLIILIFYSLTEWRLCSTTSAGKFQQKFHSAALDSGWHYRARIISWRFWCLIFSSDLDAPWSDISKYGHDVYFYLKKFPNPRLVFLVLSLMCNPPKIINTKQPTPKSKLNSPIAKQKRKIRQRWWTVFQS